MTPEKALQYAREDIAELRRAPTQQDCLALHTPIISYYRALLDCGLISVAQQNGLIEQADAELTSRKKPAQPRITPAD
jgi:hypothetical protein